MKHAINTFKFNQSMQFQTTFQFLPQEHALFLHTDNPLLTVHESTDYLAFATRNNEVALVNTKTGRTSIIHKSQHGIVELKFTHDFLLVIEFTVHEILVFSLKNQKLKKKITGHRTQISKLAYCRQLFLIASISHDQCIIFDENTLSKEKTIKCSTSSFIDCLFSSIGNVFITVFKDGSVILWDPSDYSQVNSTLPQQKLKVAINNNSFLAVYNQTKLFLSDISKNVVIYQEIDKFWEGEITRVDFVDGLIIVNTNLSLYLTQFTLEHQFKITKVKKLKNAVNDFTVAKYQSLLVLLANKLKKITMIHLTQSSRQIAKSLQSNPLTNEGLVCAGGYSNTEGCFIVNNMHTNNNYQAVKQQVQKINAINYNDIQTNLSNTKLLEFVKKHHSLPDKHRPLAYRYLLKLPISPQQFRTLQSKGRHDCSALLDTKYPLKNTKLAQAMKDVLSLLAHYHPIFAEAENVPTIIFPFVCLFGNDSFLCFQILYRLFTRPLSFLFEQFPVANSKYLQNIYEIFLLQDPELSNYFKIKELSFTQAIWGLLSTFFTANLSRQNLLSIVDSILVRPNEPSFVMFLGLGYLLYNKARILSVNNNSEMTMYFDQQHTCHIAKYLNLVQKLYLKHKHRVRYEFKLVDLEGRSYKNLPDIPQDAIKMYENRRNMISEQLLKKQEQDIYRDKMLQHMQQMTIQAKREGQRQMIEKQSYNLLCQNEAKNSLVYTSKSCTDKVDRIENLIDQLTETLNRQNRTKDILTNYIPSKPSLKVQTNEQLQALQLKLTKLLGQIKPNSFVRPLKSQPFALNKQKVNQHRAFQASINTKLANQLWKLEQQSQANQAQRWQNNMLSSLNI